MIHIDKLNLEERKAIEELRMRVETDLQKDPDLLQEGLPLFYRFLKARDFDVDKAESMLRKHINWRKAHQIQSILKDFKPKEFYRKYVEPSALGFDKEGDLVSYIPLGKLDGKEVLKCVTMNDYLNHWAWFCERCRAFITRLLNKGGNSVIQVSFIVDLDQLTFANVTNKQSADSCIRILSLLQDNYPESIKFIYLINAPSYYIIIFSILKAMMSSAMLQKFHILGHDGWKEDLQENIDPNVLPAFLGGNRTDPDDNPLCKTFVSHAGSISPIYYLSDEDRYFKDETRVVKISIPKFSKKEVCIDVTRKGSCLHWEFFVKNKDIGFGLFFNEKEEVKELLPIQRYDTVDGIETGSYRAKFTGKYIILFDNSYSWINSKEVEYCVEVVKSDL